MSSKVLKNLLEDAKNYVATAFHYFCGFCVLSEYTQEWKMQFFSIALGTHINRERRSWKFCLCFRKNIANAYSRVLMLEIVIFYGWVMRTKMKFHRHYVCIYKTCATIIYDKVSNCPLTPQRCDLVNLYFLQHNHFEMIHDLHSDTLKGCLLLFFKWKNCYDLIIKNCL